MTKIQLQYNFDGDDYIYEIDVECPDEMTLKEKENMLNKLYDENFDKACQDYEDNKLFNKNPHAYYGVNESEYH